MAITIQATTSVEALNEGELSTLCQQAGAPVFYDLRFLRAAERAHLLPIDKIYYLSAYNHGVLAGFVPMYLQPAVDPVGGLSNVSLVDPSYKGPALFSHIMHGYDSTVVLNDADPRVCSELLAAVSELAAKEGARYFGLLNVADERLIAAAPQLGLGVECMWDRHFVDLTSIKNTSEFESVFSLLPRAGRGEFRRHLRKLAKADAEVVVEAPPFVRLDEVAGLCYSTTQKYGTPQYYPPDKLESFIRECGDLVRLLSLYSEGRRTAVLVCLVEQRALHLWAGGLVYDKTGFSPYAVLFAKAFSYAVTNGIQRIEAGRANAKIKQRFGFSPRRLYCVIGDQERSEGRSGHGTVRGTNRSIK